MYGKLINFLTTAMRHDMTFILTSYVMFICRQHMQLLVEIQGDSGGKSSILVTDILGHCKKEKTSYEHVCSSDWLLR